MGGNFSQYRDLTGLTAISCTGMSPRPRGGVPPSHSTPGGTWVVGKGGRKLKKQVEAQACFCLSEWAPEPTEGKPNRGEWKERERERGESLTHSTARCHNSLSIQMFYSSGCCCFPAAIYPSIPSTASSFTASCQDLCLVEVLAWVYSSERKKKRKKQVSEGWIVNSRNTSKSRVEELKKRKMALHQRPGKSEVRNGALH